MLCSHTTPFVGDPGLVGFGGEGEVADGAFFLTGFEVPADDAGDGVVGEVVDLLPVVFALHCISVTPCRT